MISGVAPNSRIGLCWTASSKARLAAVKKIVLAAVLLANFVLVRQIVANGVHMEVAGFDQRLHGLHRRRRELRLLVLLSPGSMLLEVSGVGR